ncbi:arsenate reductase ArsC [Candidatus Bathyarchaeota archaeon]|jgi:arsenate reductase|nr:arsenate reductase ArsC [Candidatus Bathyarchaeota archaeon]
MNKASVLFLCTHNSARSQIAEGLLRHFYGERYEVFSAGSTPTQVNPLAIRVMAELGIDITGQISKSIEEFRGRDIDVVVSVCRSSPRVACAFCSSPLVGGRPEIINEVLPEAKRYIDRGFPDPSEAEGSEEEKLTAFRRTRDDIQKWITDILVPELG